MWELIEERPPTSNMRVLRAKRPTSEFALAHAAWLLDVGSNRHGERVRIPDINLCHGDTFEDLLCTVYGDPEDARLDTFVFTDRIILCG